jgi:hypothetical protein
MMLMTQGEFKDPAHLQSVDIGSTLIFLADAIPRVVLSEFLPFLSLMRMGFCFSVCSASVTRELIETLVRHQKRAIKIFHALFAQGKTNDTWEIRKTIMTTPTIITIETDKHLR